MPFNTVDELCLAYKELEANGGSYSWATLDRALVIVCTAMPRHVRVDEVSVKINIINRMYGANLHLGAKDAVQKVAEKFVEGDVDVIASALQQCSKFSSETLPPILDTHEKLVMLARQVTNRIENSFVSKYLHFHFPDTVPIFDSHAYKASWKVAPPPESEFADYNKRLSCDYGYHCGAILQIVAKLREYGVQAPKLKLLDVLLYGTR